jgi:phosphatidate cytidylyltransferase
VTSPSIPGASHSAHSLARRVAAALVMIPVVLGALWLGDPYWALLVTAACGAMAWEWRRLTARGSLGPAGLAMVGLVLAVLLLQGLGEPDTARWALIAGVLLLGLAVGLGEGVARAAWLVGGVIYVALPGLALTWLRQDPRFGLPAVLWLLLLVWAIDTAAFAAGKLIGGPKLIPRISPSKTWAGLAGGALGAALVGYLTARWGEQTSLWPLTLFSLLLAFVEQAGDAFESGIKRHFGVKDSSGLIPGHGGILDRVDGLVAVTLAVTGFILLSGGVPLADWHQ